MLLILSLCTLSIVIATLLPLSRHPHWIIRSMDFPRLQISILAATLLVAHFVFLDLSLKSTWLLLAITLLCLCWQLWWILPYNILFPKEVKTTKEDNIDRQLNIITSNVYTPNRNSDALIKLVRKFQPDILVTIESDQWWEDRLSVLEDNMPYSIKCPLDNLYGMHVYSKLPLSEKEIAYLVEDNVPSIHVSVALRTGDKIRMHFIHPAPPSPTENTFSSERDAELIVVARRVSETNQPVVVTGDLNDVAWSATTRDFRKISGLLDPRVGRGMFNTFHADYPFARWPLDHLFHSAHFTLRRIHRLPSIGSDHFALFTSLMFTPQHGQGQQGLEANAEDVDRAKKVAEGQGVSKNDVP